ncbi:MAG: transposase family protein [Chloroflexi bacterium]|nr:transposase family protein [Chloroflexota bacterium]
MRIEIPPVYTIFDSIPDWRKAKGKRYGLKNLIEFIVLAILCGKNSARAASRWGKHLPAGVKKRLGIELGQRQLELPIVLPQIEILLVTIQVQNLWYK